MWSNSAPNVICSLCHMNKGELTGDLGEGEQFCNSCGFVRGCYLMLDCCLTDLYLHLLWSVPPGGVTGKKQPVVGKDSQTSLLRQTGVFSNHSPKDSGNPGLFPRSTGISLVLWCCCRHPMETLVGEGEWILTGCGPGFLRQENDLCGRNWTKEENCFMLIAISNGKPGGELSLTGS